MSIPPQTHANRDPRSFYHAHSDARGPSTLRPAQKKFVAKGHDAQLQEAQMSGLVVRVECMDSGIDESVVGRIMKRDKFTITLRPTDPIDGEDYIIYKHAIRMIALPIRKESTPAVEPTKAE